MTVHNPPHPGELVRDTYMEPFGLGIRALARYHTVLGRFHALGA